EGASVDSPHVLTLNNWLKGADDPDPIRSLGLRPWRPVLPPVLAELDPKGPAKAAGLKTGDRLLALDGQALNNWQQVVDTVRGRAGSKIVLRIERDGAPLELPVTLASRGE
ncbi:PDZ domain-containing protein, partial [Pseudomonas frederiksbergensis]|nr:PDZ domain-containing protein [Pseudomonas frederiksbergensis]